MDMTNPEKTVIYF